MPVGDEVHFKMGWSEIENSFKFLCSLYSSEDTNINMLNR